MPPREYARQPTPFPDVNRALQHFAGQICTILAENCMGMYLYGSLAQGDFAHDSSDIDIIVVTKYHVSEAQFAALDAMHRAFRGGDSSWAEKIEVAYIYKDALNLPVSQSSAYPQLEKGRDLAWEPLEIGWPFQRYVLRNQGIVITGPDPVTLMDPVPGEDLAAAALAIVRMWRRASRSDPSWLAWVRQRQEQRFVLLTLCRSLYTLEYGTLASKSAAARWAREYLDRRWATLIAQSLMERDAAASITNQELADTLAFIDYTANRLAHSPAS